MKHQLPYIQKRLRPFNVSHRNLEGELISSIGTPLMCVGWRMCYSSAENIIVVVCNKNKSQQSPVVIKVISLVDGRILNEIMTGTQNRSISAVTYDEQNICIYTGHSNGAIMKWSN